MKHLTPLIALLPGLLCAQQGKVSDASAEKTPGVIAFEKIESAYKADFDAYVAAMNSLRKSPEYAEARKNRDNAALRALMGKVKRPDAGKYVDQCLAHAEQFSGKPAAAKSLAWVIGNAGRNRDAVQTAVDTLLADHIESPALESFAKGLPGLTRSGFSKDKVLGIANEIDENSPHDMVRAYAIYARAQLNAPRRGQRASAEVQAQIDADMEKVAELAKGSVLAMRAEAPKFKRERLQLGMVAPDIVGKDTDGVEFKLSDYRGKVVVLDFWGDW